MDKDFKRELEDYKDNLQSQLNLIYSASLPEDGGESLPAQQIDKIIFLEDQMEETQDLLDMMDDEDDRFLEKFYGITMPQAIVPKGRENSDEAYVLSLCDEVLGQVSLRQYTFDFLVGDTGRKLPVDAYYPALKLVIEYHERQHTEKVPFFDKKNTVSGVPRGEQRRIYDERRRSVLPKYGISLVEISYSDFGMHKKLHRDPIRDKFIVTGILTKYIQRK